MLLSCSCAPFSQFTSQRFVAETASVAMLLLNDPRRTFHEVDPVTGVGLGDLRIAIIKDLDEYEICIVSSETFDKAVANPPWIGPGELQDEDVGSWAWRRAKIDATAKKKDRGRSS
jgi:hypothetical protein